jgi:uridine phosphorylase
MHYPPTELVLNNEGQVYHLGIASDNIADKIILVGDQNRVEMVASFFESIEHESQHREFVCKTGLYNEKRVTALSTGIGTDNIDIVVNELDALANIDLEKRVDKSNVTSLDIVRIGTCGILQAEIPVHSYILSSHAFGLDNVAHFYEINETEEEKELNAAINGHIDLPKEIITYLRKASPKMMDKLLSDKTFQGITVTSSGFFGPQGRHLRLNSKIGHLNEQLTSFRYGNTKILNFEMESSALFALGKALGHNCGTICLGIGNRPRMEYTDGYKPHMLKLIHYVLDRI